MNRNPADLVQALQDAGVEMVIHNNDDHRLCIQLRNQVVLNWYPSARYGSDGVTLTCGAYCVDVRQLAKKTISAKEDLGKVVGKITKYLEKAAEYEQQVNQAKADREAHYARMEQRRKAKADYVEHMKATCPTDCGGNYLILGKSVPQYSAEKVFEILFDA